MRQSLVRDTTDILLVEDMLERVLHIVSAGVVTALIWKHYIARRYRCRRVDNLTSLASFEEEEVIAEGEHCVVLGHFKWQKVGEQALIKLTPRNVSASRVLSSLQLQRSSYSGAEYCYYLGLISRFASLRSDLRTSFSMEVIAPASEKQIARARPQPGVMITESACPSTPTLEQLTPLTSPPSCALG